MNVAATALDDIVRHARETMPNECCGILIGRADFVERAWAARNLAATQQTRFVIDPRDHFDAIRNARQDRLDVVGFYHSHPRSAAEPSETDAAEASGSGYLYLIVGLASDPPDLRLYRFTAGNFLPLPLVPVR